MRIQSVVDYLSSLPHANINGDKTNIMVRCCFCGDSIKHDDTAHLSIKIDVKETEPMVYKCFKCQAAGIIRTATLQQLGCMDMNTIMDLAKHNANISKTLDEFVPKMNKNYRLVNIDNRDNRTKLDYINKRLGQRLNTSDLKDLKIQLSLYDFLRLNDIRRLAFKESYCNVLDKCCIGFMSMYSDYLICRDISDGQYTGKRYTNYRTSGKPSVEDTKIYCIPGELDLLDPRSAVINVAEGAFSILGVYLNTDLGRDRRNNLFLANCGTGYNNTIEHVCRQYGLLKVRINIWSDSEISIKTYEKLYNGLKKKIDIRSFKVYYNSAAEDFGHAAKDIKINVSTII